MILPCYDTLKIVDAITITIIAWRQAGAIVCLYGDFWISHTLSASGISPTLDKILERVLEHLRLRSAQLCSGGTELTAAVRRRSTGPYGVWRRCGLVRHRAAATEHEDRVSYQYSRCNRGVRNFTASCVSIDNSCCRFSERSSDKRLLRLKSDLIMSLPNVVWPEACCFLSCSSVHLSMRQCVHVCVPKHC